MNIDLPAPERRKQPPQMDEAMPSSRSVETARGDFQLAHYELTDGPQAGVELLVIDSGRVRAAICPTRGMGLWKAHIDGLPCGWQSPVEGPVHPNFVSLHEPDGIGWLTGFDELLVRCGLHSFGPPEFNREGHLTYPLHGCIANLPARSMCVEVDQEAGELHVEAEVHEARFLQYNLRLRVRYTFRAGEPSIRIHDKVRNASAMPTSMQLLYHINLGAPLLEEGSRLHVTSRQVVARDVHAAKYMDQWQEYGGPTAGFAEEVFFMAGRADEEGWAHALLTSRDEQAGFVVHWRPENLPFFSQWKHTAATADGYVTGLEPATGFPNPRTFEAEQGRVVELAPGEERDFFVTLEGLTTSQRVAELKQKIASKVEGEIIPAEYHVQWCMPAAIKKADE